MSRPARRDRDVRAILGGVAAAVVFVVCIVAVVVAQQTTGWIPLLVMLAGLAGLIVLLWLYNRKFR